MVRGYARVSTLDLKFEPQKDALEKAGCEQVFEDHVIGAGNERPGWAQSQAALRRATRSWYGASTAWAAASSI